MRPFERGRRTGEMASTLAARRCEPWAISRCVAAVVDLVLPRLRSSPCGPRSASVANRVRFFPRARLVRWKFHRRTSLVMGRAWFAVFVSVQETGVIAEALHGAQAPPGCSLTGDRQGRAVHRRRWRRGRRLTKENSTIGAASHAGRLPAEALRPPTGERNR